MKGNFNISYEHMKNAEGGLQLHRNVTENADTYGGIFRRYHNDWVGWRYIDRGETPPESLVIDFYYEKFWMKVKGDDLPEGVDLSVFDMAVNSAPMDAIETLQVLVGSKPDGLIGSNTLREVRGSCSNLLLQSQLVLDYNSARIEHMLDCNEEDLKAYSKGWAKRVMWTNSVASNLILPF